MDAGNYTIEDFQEALYPIGNHEGTIQIEFVEINKKIKLILKHFGSTFGTLSFDENNFFPTLLKFEPHWDFKPTNAIHADSPGVYTSDKIILYINTRNKIHLKCDCIDGSIQVGVRQPILFSFVLDKPSGYKLFWHPETFHYKKNKPALNTVTFYLEEKNNGEVDFNGEKMTFRLQIIKI